MFYYYLCFLFYDYFYSFWLLSQLMQTEMRRKNIVKNGKFSACFHLTNYVQKDCRITININKKIIYLLTLMSDCKLDPRY